MSSSLFSLTSEMALIEQKIENGEDISVDDINALQVQLLEKTDNCVGYLMSLEDFEAALIERKKQIEQAIKAVQTKGIKFESYVIDCMKSLGVEKIQGKSSVIKTRKPLQVVDVLDENKVPLEYLRTKTVTEVDKKSILSDLKEGKEIDGVKLSTGKVGLNYKFGA